MPTHHSLLRQTLRSTFTGSGQRFPPDGQRDDHDGRGSLCFLGSPVSSVEFTIQQLDLGAANAEIAANGSAAQKRLLGDLLDVRSGLWNPSSLTVSNLRGQASADTKTVTIIGRTINVTPDRFSITLDVRGATQYGAFILDESRLDQERIF